MILSRRVALGGVQLDEIHERIVIRSFDPGTTDENVQTVSRMGGVGQRVTGEHWEKLEATVEFGIDIPKRDLAGRREAFEAVKKWALKKGWLTSNEMPGRRMYVDKVILPSGGDLWNWTESMEITFRALNVPFWQDETPGIAAENLITNGSISIDVSGNVTGVLDAEFTNKSGQTINRLSITAGGNTFSFTNLALGGTDTLAISHETDGLLRITAGGVSVLDKRTGADDLYVEPGNNIVTIAAERAGSLTVRNWGRWI